ncbi:MAG: hypothetical protein DSM106950_45750 [Stigonema ocellatum SAG 48.90 = DSM 106950]|nr:hypothetical protein [Stigonema ocellatum SAG 48.90 = DSM 106950]
MAVLRESPWDQQIFSEAEPRGDEAGRRSPQVCYVMCRKQSLLPVYAFFPLTLSVF